jgi:hypothetical protein
MTENVINAQPFDKKTLDKYRKAVALFIETKVRTGVCSVFSCQIQGRSHRPSNFDFLRPQK